MQELMRAASQGAALFVGDCVALAVWRRPEVSHFAGANASTGHPRGRRGSGPSGVDPGTRAAYT